MKKILTLVVAFLICIGTSVTCFADGGTVGILSLLGTSEEELNKNSQDLKDTPFSKYKYFNTYNEMVEALKNGEIDAIETDGYSAYYLIAQEDGLTEYIPKGKKKRKISYCLMVRDTDDLFNELISDAITEMKEDGTLSKLIKKHIEGAIEGNEMKKKAIPHFDNIDDDEAIETVKVLLTGDLPPIDYLSEEGVPKGFDAAFMAELGERLGVNIVLVPGSADVRDFAITENEADAVFWTRVIDYDEKEEVVAKDQPDDMQVTESYLSGALCYVVKEDSPFLSK